MGIKYLNRNLKIKCTKNAIHGISFSELKGKTIVIDTSIYIYKYLESRNFIENFFMFIAQCAEHNITPLFVFDNKPQDSKNELLQKRFEKKKIALNKYYELKDKYEKEEMSAEEKEKMWNKMCECKKQAIRVKEKHITLLKDLMNATNVYWCDAPYEADVVCAYYVKCGLAWACVSDDMDMFVYGCTRVIRDWNIVKQTAIIYDRDVIAQELGVDISYLSPMLLLLGSDYNQDMNNNVNLDTVITWYNEFSTKQVTLDENKYHCFYSWLNQMLYIKEENVKKLLEISELYNVPDNMIMKHHVVSNSTVNIMELEKILSPYGFVF